AGLNHSWHGERHNRCSCDRGGIMRDRALPFVLVLLLSGAAEAQMTWQPTQPPLVTADNETWYRAGDAIEWNGQFYYPAGAPEAFNRYQMVRAGSYRGIPLYTDATLEPYSIVFVPIAGGRMQPYERPRTGMLAGSGGSRMSAFPTAAPTEAAGARGQRAGGRAGWAGRATSSRRRRRPGSGARTIWARGRCRSGSRRRFPWSPETSVPPQRRRALVRPPRAAARSPLPTRPRAAIARKAST